MEKTKSQFIKYAYYKRYRERINRKESKRTRLNNIYTIFWWVFSCFCLFVFSVLFYNPFTELLLIVNEQSTEILFSQIIVTIVISLSVGFLWLSAFLGFSITTDKIKKLLTE